VTFRFSPICLLLVLILGWSVAEAQQVIRVGSYVQEKSIGVSRIISPWVESVRKDAGDTLRIETFWGGTLGKSPHRQFELVQSGVLDVAWVLPGYASGQFPEMGLFELPFLFESAEEASVVGWSLYQQGLLTGFEDVHLIGFFTTEPNALFMKTPIETLFDINNMKIRSLGAIHAKWLEAYGASSQTLSAADMNQALNRGVIDGVIQGWTGMRTFKSYPLIEQSYSIPIGTTPFLILMNRKTWQGLPDDVKSVMLRHGGLQIARAGGQAYAQVGGSIRKALEEEGRIMMSRPDDTQRKAYLDQTQLIHQWWIDKTVNGKTIYDTTIALLSDLRGAGR